MKVIILVISAVAIVGGSYNQQGWNQQGWKQQGWNAPTNYHQGAAPSHAPVQKYPEHIPVIGKDGVPLETPEVQAAKDHFHSEYQRAAALAAQKPDPYEGQYEEQKYTSVNNNGWNGASNRVAPVQATPIWEDHNDYNNNQGYNQAYRNQANNNHAYNNQGYNSQRYTNQAQNNQAYNNQGYNNQAYNNQGYNHNGYVPVETPEVQQAKAAHFQAFATAAARAAAQKQNQHNRYRRSINEWAQPKYNGPIHIPKITAHGVPADTAEVEHARLNHLKALNDAASKAHAAGYVEEHNSWNGDNGAYNHGQSADWSSSPVNADYHEKKWNGPIHIPVLDHNGVPVEPHEVQHARQEHLSALAAESSKHAGWNGVHQKW
ncbi:hypothetical protein WA026_000065 [Henosepilachna vigintioctopunctata]|uniref:Uncharacterized protein n=1 Tax=Henosepilachna vigintioctopunctata TaxID=420089 RepID=A0AAW1V3Z7_9CUCU